MNTIVLLSGGPSDTSRSEAVLRYVDERLKHQSVQTQLISARELNPAALIHSDYLAEEILEVARVLAKADGVIVAPPVYNVSLSGILKAMLDLLSREIFRGKPVFPLMVGGTEKHFMALDYALKPVLAFMKGNLLAACTCWKVILIARQPCH